MKKTVVKLLACLVVSGIILNFSSCGKVESTAPNVSFRTSTSLVSYISQDTSLLHGTIFNIGINGDNSGSENLVTYCKISKSLNGGADSTIQEMNFVTQYFSHYYSYQAGDSGNAERYTFTMSNEEGLANTVSLTITDI